MPDFIVSCFDAAGLTWRRERLNGESYLHAHRVAQQMFAEHHRVEVWEGDTCLLTLDRSTAPPPSRRR